MTSPDQPADGNIRIPVDPGILQALKDQERNRLAEENLQLRAVLETVTQGASRLGLTLAQLCAAPPQPSNPTIPNAPFPGWETKEVKDEPLVPRAAPETAPTNGSTST